MSKVKKIFYHLYYSIKRGEWSMGFESRKTWPGKPYLRFFRTYYDGHHFCIHLWWFYIGASYY